MNWRQPLVKTSCVIVFSLVCGCSTTDKPMSNSEYIHRIPGNILQDFKDTFSDDSLKKIGLLTLSTAGWSENSEKAREFYRDHGSIATDFGNKYLGEGGTMFATSLILYGLGQGLQNKNLSDTGMAMFEGFLQTGFQVQSLKLITNEQRPNGSDRKSFPSGHAAVYGTVYGTLLTMTDGKNEFLHSVIAIVGAVGAGVVMESRMDSNAHWFHDVGAGLLIGFWNGQRAARRYNPNARDFSKINDDWTIEPWIADDIIGISFHYEIKNPSYRKRSHKY